MNSAAIPKAVKMPTINFGATGRTAGRTVRSRPPMLMAGTEDGKTRVWCAGLRRRARLERSHLRRDIAFQETGAGGPAATAPAEAIAQTPSQRWPPLISQRANHHGISLCPNPAVGNQALPAWEVKYTKPAVQSRKMREGQRHASIAEPASASIAERNPANPGDVFQVARQNSAWFTMYKHQQRRHSVSRRTAPRLLVNASRKKSPLGLP